MGNCGSTCRVWGGWIRSKWRIRVPGSRVRGDTALQKVPGTERRPANAKGGGTQLCGNAVGMSLHKALTVAYSRKIPRRIVSRIVHIPAAIVCKKEKKNNGNITLSITDDFLHWVSCESYYVTLIIILRRKYE